MVLFNIKSQVAKHYRLEGFTGSKRSVTERNCPAANTITKIFHINTNLKGERGGSVVECRTPEREVGGSKPTAAVLCP